MKLSLQNGRSLNSCGMWKPEYIKIATSENIFWAPWQNYLTLLGFIYIAKASLKQLSRLTPCKVEQPLHSMELQEKRNKKIKAYKKSV